MRSPDGVARLDHAVAAFVADLVEEGGPDCAVLEDIVKGFIVQNALLLRDIPITGRHLDGLTVFVDTGVFRWRRWSVRIDHFFVMCAAGRAVTRPEQEIQL